MHRLWSEGIPNGTRAMRGWRVSLVCTTDARVSFQARMLAFGAAAAGGADVGGDGHRSGGRGRGRAGRHRLG